MSPPHRTRTELRSAVYHITYELEAMRRAATRFSQHDRRFDLEAALLHARNLTDFFWTPCGSRRAHRDGVYAVDFFGDPRAWRTRRSALPQQPNERYDALSAQLAHISIKRNQRDVVVDFERALQRIVADLGTVWDCFLAALAGTDWPTRFRRRQLRWRATA
jgi:hypothetical protein